MRSWRFFATKTDDGQEVPEVVITEFEVESARLFMRAVASNLSRQNVKVRDFAEEMSDEDAGKMIARSFVSIQTGLDDDMIASMIYYGRAAAYLVDGGPRFFYDAESSEIVDTAPDPTEDDDGNDGGGEDSPKIVN